MAQFHFKNSGWCNASRYDQRRFSNDNHLTDDGISRYLSFILRHPNDHFRQLMNKEGYIYVEHILRLGRFRGRIGLRDIHRIVESNSKRRFAIDYDSNGNAMIRATQGHSVDVNPGLSLIKDPHLYPVVVHGTTYKAWESIRNEGLHNMNRAYIHFAIGMPEDRGVISGMRNSSEICIFIDLARAISAGIKFFIAENNVILSKGYLGTIETCFFTRVIDRRTRENLRW
ncbi:tRNA 2'-phosphotransferase 1-like isoform X1 [Argonauta hians]